ATLLFWQKYWILTGQNGGVITVGTSNAITAPKYNSTSWTWHYIMPETPYSGNLNLTDYHTIAHLPIGDEWAYNGASAGGTFGWEQAVVNLTQFNTYKWIIVNFTYWQFGVPQKTSPYDVYRGWYLDNIQVEVTGGPYQYWQLTNASNIGEIGNPNYYGITSKYSNYWMFSNYTNTQNPDSLPLGVDSALITKQIDLSNAYNATLNAYFKFNLNNASGLPPEIIRVEVSDNDGQSWTSITYGVRIGWNASGTGGYAGTSATGTYGWVNGNTLLRLSTDLSGWAGQTILIKFRVITNSLATYQPYAPNGQSDPLAIFIGDVSVTGVGSAAVDYPSWGI
ncbi:MAG: type IV pilin, partial [Thermoplasmata archaeon]